jgi:transposase InsO family protein
MAPSREFYHPLSSNTMTPDFCVDALTEAIARYGAPEIVNTDQGSQFTSKSWTDVLDAAGVRISVDGKSVGSTTCSSSDCGAA